MHPYFFSSFSDSLKELPGLRWLHNNQPVARPKNVCACMKNEHSLCLSALPTDMKSGAIHIFTPIKKNTITQYFCIAAKFLILLLLCYIHNIFILWCLDWALTFGFALVVFFHIHWSGFLHKTNTKTKENLYFDKMNGHLLMRCCCKIKYRP